jgi:hypothetical protein
MAIICPNQRMSVFSIIRPIAAPMTGGAVPKVFKIVRELADGGNAIALPLIGAPGSPIARRVGCRTFSRSTSQ